MNAIAAHHQEVEYASQEAPIVQVADAISASRPGARGESMETYVRRLEDLQAIAESFEGVEKSFAVQAGREVRVLVKPDQIDDVMASRLARDVCKKIEASLDVPGPDQGDGHPRDAVRRIRQVAAWPRRGVAPLGRSGREGSAGS